MTEDMRKKVVLVVGAGATVADVASRSKRSRPPLDKGFFSIARSTDKTITGRIASYIKGIYGMDIYDAGNDSLEKIMAIIYTDIFDPNLKEGALSIFRALIRLFNLRLAATTNDIRPTQQRYLYRIITEFLQSGVRPEDITIITFNQDIQIEKILLNINSKSKYKHCGNVFTFPGCYYLPIEPSNITYPVGPKSGGPRDDVFPTDKPDLREGVAVLKLHGSLNWYSCHSKTNVTPNTMFKPNRTIHLTVRMSINPVMKMQSKPRFQYTIPVIVPPVTHKSGILHDDVKQLWSIAEERIRWANEAVIFGYSCPVIDFESSNFIQRSLRGNPLCKKISIIDPDPNILSRYIKLIEPREIHYYPYANDYLDRIQRL